MYAKQTISEKAKQKLLGILAIGVSILTPLLLDGDATASLFILPLGLCSLFSRENILN